MAFRFAACIHDASDVVGGVDEAAVMLVTDDEAHAELVVNVVDLNVVVDVVAELVDVEAFPSC